jgi:DNA-binding transcriptional LysR family regulator
MLSRIQLRQFLAVVDTGTFTRAAHLLNVAQPSLSAGIAQLERELGTRLFVRERRRIRLTEAGNALLPLARAIERDFHRAERQVGSLPVPARPVRLGVLESISTGWLEKVVARYDGNEPLDLTEGSERELQSALANGSLDLALTLVSRKAPRGTSDVLFDEDYCLALPASHPLATQSSVRVEAVAVETMIARRACEVLGETSRFFTEHGVRPRFALRSSNDDRALAMVRAGLGVTVAPRSLARDGVAMVGIEGFGLSRTVGFLFGPHWDEEFGDDHPLLRAFRAVPFATRG